MNEEDRTNSKNPPSKRPGRRTSRDAIATSHERGDRSVSSSGRPPKLSTQAPVHVQDPRHRVSPLFLRSPPRERSQLPTGLKLSLPSGDPIVPRWLPVPHHSAQKGDFGETTSVWGAISRDGRSASVARTPKAAMGDTACHVAVGATLKAGTPAISVKSSTTLNVKHREGALFSTGINCDMEQSELRRAGTRPRGDNKQSVKDGSPGLSASSSVSVEVKQTFGKTPTGSLGMVPSTATRGRSPHGPEPSRNGSSLEVTSTVTLAPPVQGAKDEAGSAPRTPAQKRSLMIDISFTKPRAPEKNQSILRSISANVERIMGRLLQSRPEDKKGTVETGRGVVESPGESLETLTKGAEVPGPSVGILSPLKRAGKTPDLVDKVPSQKQETVDGKVPLKAPLTPKEGKREESLKKALSPKQVLTPQESRSKLGPKQVSRKGEKEKEDGRERGQGTLKSTETKEDLKSKMSRGEKDKGKPDTNGSAISRMLSAVKHDKDEKIKSKKATKAKEEEGMTEMLQSVFEEKGKKVKKKGKALQQSGKDELLTELMASSIDAKDKKLKTKAKQPKSAAKDEAMTEMLISTIDNKKKLPKKKGKQSKESAKDELLSEMVTSVIEQKGKQVKKKGKGQKDAAKDELLTEMMTSKIDEKGGKARKKKTEEKSPKKEEEKIVKKEKDKKDSGKEELPTKAPAAELEDKGRKKTILEKKDEGLADKADIKKKDVAGEAVETKKDSGKGALAAEPVSPAIAGDVTKVTKEEMKERKVSEAEEKATVPLGENIDEKGSGQALGISGEDTKATKVGAVDEKVSVVDKKGSGRPSEPIDEKEKGKTPAITEEDAKAMKVGKIDKEASEAKQIATGRPDETIDEKEKSKAPVTTGKDTKAMKEDVKDKKVPETVEKATARLDEDIGEKDRNKALPKREERVKGEGVLRVDDVVEKQAKHKREKDGGAGSKKQVHEVKGADSKVKKEIVTAHRHEDIDDKVRETVTPDTEGDVFSVVVIVEKKKKSKRPTSDDADAGKKQEADTIKIAIIKEKADEKIAVHPDEGTGEKRELKSPSGVEKEGIIGTDVKQKDKEHLKDGVDGRGKPEWDTAKMAEAKEKGKVTPRLHEDADERAKEEKGKSPPKREQDLEKKDVSGENVIGDKKKKHKKPVKDGMDGNEKPEFDKEKGADGKEKRREDKETRRLPEGIDEQVKEKKSKAPLKRENNLEKMNVAGEDVVGDNKKAVKKHRKVDKGGTGKPGPEGEETKKGRDVEVKAFPHVKADEGQKQRVDDGAAPPSHIVPPAVEVHRKDAPQVPVESGTRRRASMFPIDGRIEFQQLETGQELDDFIDAFEMALEPITLQAGTSASTAEPPTIKPEDSIKPAMKLKTPHLKTTVEPVAATPVTQLRSPELRITKPDRAAKAKVEATKAVSPKPAVSPMSPRGGKRSMSIKGGGIEFGEPVQLEQGQDIDDFIDAFEIALEPITLEAVERKSPFLPEADKLDLDVGEPELRKRSVSKNVQMFKWNTARVPSVAGVYRGLSWSTTQLRRAGVTILGAEAGELVWSTSKMAHPGPDDAEKLIKGHGGSVKISHLAIDHKESKPSTDKKPKRRKRSLGGAESEAGEGREPDALSATTQGTATAVNASIASGTALMATSGTSARTDGNLIPEGVTPEVAAADLKAADKTLEAKRQEGKRRGSGKKENRADEGDKKGKESRKSSKSAKKGSKKRSRKGSKKGRKKRSKKDSKKGSKKDTKKEAKEDSKKDSKRDSKKSSKKDSKKAASKKDSKKRSRKGSKKKGKKPSDKISEKKSRRKKKDDGAEKVKTKKAGPTRDVVVQHVDNTPYLCCCLLIMAILTVAVMLMAYLLLIPPDISSTRMSFSVTTSGNASSETEMETTTMTVLIRTIAETPETTEAPEATSQRPPVTLPRNIYFCNTTFCEREGSYLRSLVHNRGDPCDNFYEYACSAWSKQNPTDQRNMGSHVSRDTLLQDALGKRLIPLIQSATEEDVRVAKDLLNLCTSSSKNNAAVESSREKFRNWTIKTWPTARDDITIPTVWQFAAELFRDLNIATILDVTVGVNPFELDETVLELGQPDWLLPIDKKSEALFIGAVSEAMSIFSSAPNGVLPDQVMSVAKRLSTARDVEQDRQTLKYADKLDPDVQIFLDILLPNILEATPNQRVVLKSPNYIAHISDLLSDLRLPDMLNYMGFLALVETAPFFDSTSLRELFAWRVMGRPLDHPSDPKALCFRAVERLLPGCFSKVSSTIFQVNGGNVATREWISLLESAFKNNIRNLAWFDELSSQIVQYHLKRRPVTHFGHNQTCAPSMNQLSMNRPLLLYYHVSFLQQQQRLRAIFSGSAELKQRSLGSVLDTHARYDPSRQRVHVPIAMLNTSIPSTGSMFAFHLSRFAVRFYRALIHVLSENIYEGEAPLTFQRESLLERDELWKCLEDLKNVPSGLRSSLSPEVSTAPGLMNQTVALKLSHRAFHELLVTRRVWSMDFRYMNLPNFTSEMLFFVYFALDNCESTDAVYRQRRRSSLPADILVNLPLRHLREFSAAFGCLEGSNMLPDDNFACKVFRDDDTSHKAAIPNARRTMFRYDLVPIRGQF